MVAGGLGPGGGAVTLGRNGPRSDAARTGSPALGRALREPQDTPAGSPEVALRQGAPQKAPQPGPRGPATLEPRDPQNPELTSRRRKPDPLLPAGLGAES